MSTRMPANSDKSDLFTLFMELSSYELFKVFRQCLLFSSIHCPAVTKFRERLAMTCYCDTNFCNIKLCTQLSRVELPGGTYIISVSGTTQLRQLYDLLPMSRSELYKTEQTVLH